jgi:hypothetical protein
MAVIGIAKRTIRKGQRLVLLRSGVHRLVGGRESFWRHVVAKGDDQGEEVLLVPVAGVVERDYQAGEQVNTVPE